MYACLWLRGFEVHEKIAPLSGRCRRCTTVVLNMSCSRDNSGHPRRIGSSWGPQYNV